MIDGQGRFDLLKSRKRTDWNSLTAIGTDVDIRQILGVVAILWFCFKDNTILIQLREKNGNLSLAERVVKRIVHHLRRDAKPRSGVAIDDDASLQSFCL